jgi:hypothetical protein
MCTEVTLCGSHLKPGGWVQFGENTAEMRCDDNSMPEDWPPKVCTDLGRKGVAAIGRHIPNGEELRQALTVAGFTDITVSNLHEIESARVESVRDCTCVN